MYVLIFLNQGIIEETIQLLKKEESHKVIAQGVSALLRLGKLLPDNASVHQKLVLVAKQVSTDFYCCRSFKKNTCMRKCYGVLINPIYTE
jgi:hypothetical protein